MNSMWQFFEFHIPYQINPKMLDNRYVEIAKGDEKERSRILFLDFLHDIVQQGEHCAVSTVLLDPQLLTIKNNKETTRVYFNSDDYFLKKTSHIAI